MRAKAGILEDFPKFSKNHLWFDSHTYDPGYAAREELEELERRRDRCAGAPQASQSPETCLIGMMSLVPVDFYSDWSHHHRLPMVFAISSIKKNIRKIP